MASSSKTTTDHDTIRKWAEARGARPATVKGTAKNDEAGVIRLNFPGYDEDRLEDISWDEWFEKFDENKLALLYQEETAGGQQSNFNKLVSRKTAEADDQREHHAKNDKSAHKTHK